MRLPLFVLICFASISLGIPARAELSVKAWKVLHGAELHMENQEYKKAIQSMRSYMDKQDSVPEQLYLLLGNCYLETDAAKAALSLLKKGVEKYPDSFYLRYNLGIAANEQEHYLLAGENFAKAYDLQQKNRKQHGDSPSLLYYSAACYFQGQKYSRALTLLERLLVRNDLKQKKERLEWIKLQVHILCQLKKWSKAAKVLKNLLRQRPELYDYWRLLARVEMYRDRYTQAAAALETAHGLNPPKPSDWRQLADIYIYLNAPLSAVRCLGLAASSETNNKKLASLYEKSNRYEDAIKTCRKLIEKDPCADNYLLLGHTQLNGGMQQESIESFSKAASSPPCKKKKRKERSRSKKKTEGEAWLMAALTAWDLQDWDQALYFFDLTKNTVPPYAKRGAQGYSYIQNILASRMTVDERMDVPKLRND